MKKLLNAFTIALFTIALSGCLASTTSPDGLTCSFSQQKPLWEMPPGCYGGG
jgi:hypothetical protein